jgi:hypothetical protein
MSDRKFDPHQQTAAFPVPCGHPAADSFDVSPYDPQPDSEMQRVARTGRLDRLVEGYHGPHDAIGTGGIQRPVLR